MYVWKIKINKNILFNFAIECNYDNVNSRYKNIYSSTIRIFYTNFNYIFILFKMEIKKCDYFKLYKL